MPNAQRSLEPVMATVSAPHKEISPVRERLIFEDSELQVFFRSGSTTFLLITFNELGTLAGNGRFWGQALAEKADISTLGIVTKSASWFPAQSMRTMSEVANNFTASYSERILYGHSMGGYAALKYSRMLNATVSLSFCPQFSINPDDIPFDSRYQQYFPLNNDTEMSIRGSDAVGRQFIFWDPFEQRDSAHIKKILEHLPTVTLVPVYMTLHRSVKPFADTGASTKMFDLALKGDIAGMRHLANARRRLSSERTFALACVAYQNHPELSARLMDKYHRHSKYEQNLYFNHIVEFLEKLPESNKRSRLSASIARYPYAAPLLYRMSNLLLQVGNQEQALIYAERTVSAQPEVASYQSHYAAMLGSARRLDEAEAAIRRAAAISPRSVGILCRLSDILSRKGLLDEAFTFAHEAQLLDPKNVDVRRHLVGLHMLRQEFSEAEELLVPVLQRLPSDARVLKQMSDLQFRRGDINQAIHWARKASNASPNDLQARDRVSNLLSQRTDRQNPSVCKVPYTGADVTVRAKLFPGVTCYVTFSGWGVNDTGFGEAYFEKAGLSAIHVLSLWSHWWQTDEMSEVMSVITALIQESGFQSVVTYGASMGGYGAALFSTALRADLVIAIAPQFSIDPRKMPKERRWRAEAKKLSFLNDDMEHGIRQDIRKYVIFDPNSPDIHHAYRFSQFQNVTSISVPFGGHIPGFLLQEVGMLHNLISDLTHDRLDITAFLSKLRKCRRLSKTYWTNVAAIAERRRPDLAIVALHKALELKPADASLMTELSGVYYRQKSYNRAVDWARKAVIGAPKDPNALAHLSGVLIETNSLLEAKQAMERSLALRRSASGLLRMSHICLLESDYEAAHSWAARAVEADPANIRARIFLIDVHLKSSNYTEAGKIISEALRIEADNPDVLKRQFIVSAKLRAK